MKGETKLVLVGIMSLIFCISMFIFINPVYSNPAPANPDFVINTTWNTSNSFGWKNGTQVNSTDDGIFYMETQWDNPYVPENSITLANRQGDNFTAYKNYSSTYDSGFKWNLTSALQTNLGRMGLNNTYPNYLAYNRRDTGNGGQLMDSTKQWHLNLSDSFDISVKWDIIQNDSNGASEFAIYQNTTDYVRMWKESSGNMRVICYIERSDSITTRLITNYNLSGGFRVTNDGAGNVACYYDGDASNETEQWIEMKSVNNYGTDHAPLVRMRTRATTNNGANCTTHWHDLNISEGTLVDEDGVAVNTHVTSGNWTSATIGIDTDEKLLNVSIGFSDVDASNYIDKVEFLNSTGDILATNETDITSGTDITYSNDNGLDTGDFDYLNYTENMQVRFYLVGDGTSSPIISEIYGFYESLDNTPPQITINRPINSTYTNDTLEFDISLDEDGSWCYYSIDDGGNITMTNQTGSWNHVNTTIMNMDTTYNVTFYCSDTIGNENSTSNYFTVMNNYNCYYSNISTEIAGVVLNLTDSLTIQSDEDLTCNDTSSIITGSQIDNYGNLTFRNYDLILEDLAGLPPTRSSIYGYANSRTIVVNQSNLTGDTLQQPDVYIQTDAIFQANDSYFNYIGDASGSDGVAITGNNSTIINNTFYGGEVYAIRLIAGSDDFYISNNSIDGFDSGIHVLSDSGEVYYNTITNSDDEHIYLGGDSNILEGNSLDGSDDMGIHIVNALSNTIYNNDIYNIINYAIEFENGDYNIISNNSFDYNTAGIWTYIVNDDDFNTIANNTFYNSNYSAMSLFNSDNTTIERNYIYNPIIYGILIAGTEESNIIEYNEIYGTKIGIRIGDTAPNDYHQVRYNTIYNTSTAIFTKNADYLIIDNNTISFNTLGFEANTVTGSSFVNNYISFNNDDIIEDSSLFVYGNNTFFLNRNSSMIKQHRYIGVEDEMLVFNITFSYPNGTAFPTYRIGPVGRFEDFPNASLNMSNQEYYIYGNITPEDTGIYSISIADMRDQITDYNNFTHVISYGITDGLFNSTYNTTYYLDPARLTAHHNGDAGITDTSGFVFEKSMVDHQYCTCGDWIQASLDEKLVYNNLTIHNISLDFLYKSTNPPTIGIQEDFSYAESGLDFVEVLPENANIPYLHNSTLFDNLYWDMETEIDMYNITAKLNDTNPELSTNSTYPSFLNMTYESSVPTPLIHDQYGIEIYSEKSYNGYNSTEIRFYSERDASFELQMPNDNDVNVYLDSANCSSEPICNYTSSGRYVYVDMDLTGSIYNLTVEAPEFEVETESWINPLHDSTFTNSSNQTFEIEHIIRIVNATGSFTFASDESSCNITLLMPNASYFIINQSMTNDTVNSRYNYTEDFRDLPLGDWTATYTCLYVLGVEETIATLTETFRLTEADLITGLLDMVYSTVLSSELNLLFGIIFIFIGLLLLYRLYKYMYNRKIKKYGVKNDNRLNRY